MKKTVILKRSHVAIVVFLVEVCESLYVQQTNDGNEEACRRRCGNWIELILIDRNWELATMGETTVGIHDCLFVSANHQADFWWRKLVCGVEAVLVSPWSPVFFFNRQFIATWKYYSVRCIIMLSVLCSMPFVLNQ